MDRQAVSQQDAKICSPARTTQPRKVCSPPATSARWAALGHRSSKPAPFSSKGQGHRHCGLCLPALPDRAAGSCSSSRNTFRVRQDALGPFSSEQLPTWDVLGLGQAMVDFAAAVDDDFLKAMNIEKGVRRIISVEERAELLEALGGSSYQVIAGGSLTNSITALSRLGQADPKCGPLRIGLSAIVGSDALGSFYCAQLRQAGVDLVGAPEPSSNTGTVIVLTTPDAQRTFLSYLGSPAQLELTPALEVAIQRSRMLIIEGYLWEMPNALAFIQEAVAAARQAGTAVALTAGDPGVVTRHREQLWEVLQAGVDVLFTNREEACQLVGRPGCSAQEAALALGPHCGLVCVTDGANGSCLTALGQLQVVPPFWASSPPVDTCGAGDAYAAGLLFGHLAGFDVTRMGRLAARTASAVIGKHGATLTQAEAAYAIGQPVATQPMLPEAALPAESL